MKNAIVTLLASFLQKLKQGNQFVYLLIQAALIAAFTVITQGFDNGIISETPILKEITEYLSLILMALIGTHTVDDLPDTIDPDDLKERFAKILDSLKMKSPTVFGVVQIILITIYSVLMYGGFELNNTLQTILKTVTILAIILVGSRTGRFLK